MSQSISNALLFNLIITFVVILLAFFIGSLSYSKASKVNNRIVEEIEKQGEGVGGSSQIDIVNNAYKNAACDILTWLDKGDRGDSTGIGYRKVGYTNRHCPTAQDLMDNNSISGEAVEVTFTDLTNQVDKQGRACDYNTNPYEYCVYRVNECSVGQSCYTYYHVITYMYFDVPIVADLIRLPVHGETMGFRIKNS